MKSMFSQFLVQKIVGAFRVKSFYTELDTVTSCLDVTVWFDAKNLPSPTSYRFTLYCT